MNNNFYSGVEIYYDSDAADFDQRYWSNPVLQKMRQVFREEVKRHQSTNILEVGCGTGLDLVHFGMTHPESQVYGIDISGEMCRITSQRIISKKLKNVQVAKGSVEDISNLFPGKKFDLIYVFFGALNTVENLRQAAIQLQEVLSEHGIMVLTFVNKYYLAGMLIELVKLRFSNAFARLKRNWGGYSPVKKMPSRCYSPIEIKFNFREMKLLRQQGLCIVHPAWFYHGLNKKISRLSLLLWKLDRWLNATPLWRFGEYSLFVLQKN